MTNVQLNLGDSLKPLSNKEVVIPNLINLNRFPCENQYHMHIQIRTGLDAIASINEIESIKQKEPLITQFKPVNKDHFKFKSHVDAEPIPMPKIIDERPLLQFRIERYNELKNEHNIAPKTANIDIPIFSKPYGLSITPKDVMKEKPFKPVSKVYFKSTLNFEQTKVLKDLSNNSASNINSNVISKLTNRGFALFNNNKWSITNKGLDYLDNVAI